MPANDDIAFQSETLPRCSSHILWTGVGKGQVERRRSSKSGCACRGGDSLCIKFRNSTVRFGGGTPGV